MKFEFFIHTMILNIHLLRLLHHISFTGVNAFISSIYLSLYQNAVRVPKLLLPKDPSPGITTILSNLSFLQRPFYPHPLTILPTCWPLVRGVMTTMHLSSLMPFFAASPLRMLGLGPDQSVYSEKITCKDGGHVCLVWPSQHSFIHGDDIVLIFPGMNNSSETGFIRLLQKRLQAKLALKGRRRSHVVIVDYRLTGTSLRDDVGGDHPACADGWQDFECIFEHLQDTCGADTEVHCVAESLGAGMLLKYLGCHPTPSAMIKSAVCASPPVHYADIASHLESTFVSRVCNFMMATPPKIALLMTPQMRARVPSLWNAMTALSVRQFEQAVLIPLLDYKSPEEYYELNSPADTLQHISIPTLIICSTDDPITPPPSQSLTRDCANIAVVEVNYGGHLGFFQLSLTSSSFADDLICEWVKKAKAELPPPPPEGGGGSTGKRSPSIKERRRSRFRGATLGF